MADHRSAELSENQTQARVEWQNATDEERAEARRRWEALTEDEQEELRRQAELDLL